MSNPSFSVTKFAGAVALATPAILLIANIQNKPLVKWLTSIGWGWIPVVAGAILLAILIVALVEFPSKASTYGAFVVLIVSTALVVMYWPAIFGWLRSFSWASLVLVGYVAFALLYAYWVAGGPFKLPRKKVVAQETTTA